MIKYKLIKFEIEFESSIRFIVYPTFVFRSVLGKELRRMACIFKGSECNDCSLKYTCVYSYLFESPIDKNNPVLKGRNFVSHPFLLRTDNIMNQDTRSIVLEILLIGKGIEYLPYIYFALVKAGEKGIFRDRVKYRITNVLINESSIMQSSDRIIMDFKRDEWSFDVDSNVSFGSVSIYFVSPYRVKYKGKYGTDFGVTDFFNSVRRRMIVLGKVYGNLIDGEVLYNTFNAEYKIIEKNLYWHDLNYYSSRQKQRLKMGGVLGNMRIAGNFASKEIALLKGAEVFHIGKNPGFGLGRVKVEFKK